jgi:hypothetical protein
MDNPLMVADILIWESTNALMLIPVVIGLVMLVRWMRGRPVFTDKDWLFLIWPCAGESLLASLVAKIRGDMDCGRAYRIC